MKVKFIGHYYGHVLEDYINEFIRNPKNKVHSVINIEYSTQKVEGELVASALITYVEGRTPTENYMEP